MNIWFNVYKYTLGGWTGVSTSRSECPSASSFLPRPIRLFINNKCKLSRGILNCKSLVSRRLPIFLQSLWLFIYFSRSALACVGNNIGDCQFLCNPNNYSSISHALLLTVLLTSHITTIVQKIWNSVDFILKRVAIFRIFTDF